MKREVEEVVGLDCSGAILASAKQGIGIDAILEAVVARIPPPPDTTGRPLRALIFDSYYDPYKVRAWGPWQGGNSELISSIISCASYAKCQPGVWVTLMRECMCVRVRSPMVWGDWCPVFHGRGTNDGNACKVHFCDVVQPSAGMRCTGSMGPWGQPSPLLPILGHDPSVSCSALLSAQETLVATLASLEG